MPARPDGKLPVPGPWQAPARAAIADLVGRLGLRAAAVAVTRAEEASWPVAGGVASGLRVWLVAGARTVRYRIDVSAALAPEPEPPSEPT